MNDWRDPVSAKKAGPAGLNGVRIGFNGAKVGFKWGLIGFVFDF